MERCLRLFLVLLAATLLGGAVGGAAAQQKQAAYSPGLGDLMTMTVQPRYTKLGLAAREGNWSYASCQLHELKEAFDRAAKTLPKWRTFEIPAMMDSVITGPMAALDRAIKANDSAHFTADYEQLTVACNTCRRSADRGVIVIQSPAGSPFADQDFQPVKE